MSEVTMKRSPSRIFLSRKQTFSHLVVLNYLGTLHRYMRNWAELLQEDTAEMEENGNVFNNLGSKK